MYNTVIKYWNGGWNPNNKEKRVKKKKKGRKTAKKLIILAVFVPTK